MLKNTLIFSFRLGLGLGRDLPLLDRGFGGVAPKIRGFGE